MRLKRAVFFDRDGTLNLDRGYTHKPEDWVWLPGTLKGLRRLQAAGWMLVVISNQSGIGRGYYGWEQLKKLENWLIGQLAAEGIAISGWYYCPHMPDEGCCCRKPAPGLLLEAGANLSLNLKDSWMLGDRITDIQAGSAAGCSCGLIAPSQDSPEVLAARIDWPDLPVWPDIDAAATGIIELTGVSVLSG